MKKEIIEKIEDLVEETPADFYKKGYNWNGYEVYELGFNKPACVGTFRVILVKDNEVRLSTAEEGLLYLDYSEEKDNKSKTTK